MNTGSSRMDSGLTGMWVSFFTAAGIPSEVGASYALTFTENRIQTDMLLDLNKEILRDMGISRMGDVIAILRHAKQVHESTARERVLSSTSTITTKVPVALVTGRSTLTQPSSPASRILEHYTRNPQAQDTSPVQAQKRKSLVTGPSDDDYIKKARMIRFGTAPRSVVKEAPKQTVFARLGVTETTAVATKVNTAAIPKYDSKPVFARLGSKADEVTTTDALIPVPKDALKYEGILKSNPTASTAKNVTVTTTKNNVRRIACTMRADETPLSVKEKLALPKSKSVKFSNTVQYKEIDKVTVNVKPKFSPVFNKPERRLSNLSMPEPSNSVKERLGLKKPIDLTITKNVFNRLGV